MNQQSKCRVLKKVYKLEDMVKALTDEVKGCYEFGRCSGEFFERGDLVGFINPVYIQNGHVLPKGEVEEVYPNKHKVKIYCRNYCGPLRPCQHVSFVVGYDRIFLIKGNELDEEIAMPSKESTIEDLEIISD